MIEDIEDMIKEKLLMDLIEQMGNKSGERLKPKGLGVEIEAADKDGLSQGLDHAKKSLGSLPESGEEPNEEDDLERLLEMAGKDGDEDDEDDELDQKRRG